MPRARTEIEAMKRTHRVLQIVAMVATIGSGRGVFAQSSTPEVALAEALYRQARQLMADGKYAEACPKFAESHRLDPATGTLLNLAACHEAEQKLATAWLEYAEASMMARRDQREDRVRFAQEHQAAIEPKLSRLNVIVPPAADLPELEIQVDGAPIRPAARGVPTPVDPGIHVIQARARDRRPWSKRVEIGPGPSNQTITIPVLEPAPEVAKPAAPSTISAAPSRAETAGRDTLSRPLSAPVYVAGTVTLLTATGAGVTGVLYLGKNNGDHLDDAKRWGTINAVFWGATALGAGITTYLYLTRPEKREAAAVTSHPMIAPWMSASGGGVVVQGTL